MQSVDPAAVGSQPRLETALLVAEVRAFVDAWQLVLASAGPWTPEQVKLLRDRCKGLQARARAAGVGGLVHHLGSCERCLGSPIPDRDEIGRCLGNVTQVAWQLEQEAERHARASADAPSIASAASSGDAEVPSPPPPPPLAVPVPPLLQALPLADTVSPEKAPPEKLTPEKAAPLEPSAPPRPAVSASPRVNAPPPLAPSAPRRVAEPPPLNLSQPMAAVPSLNIPPPPPLDASQLSHADDLAAKALRARLRAAAVSVDVQPPELLRLPAAASVELIYAPPRPDPRRLESEDAAVVLAEVLGMSMADGSAPGPALTSAPARVDLVPPPPLGPDSSGLPLLAPPAPLASHLIHRDLDARLDRIRRAGSYPIQEPPALRARVSEPAPEAPLADALRARPGGVRWWAGPLGVGVVGGVVGLVLLLLRPRPDAPVLDPEEPPLQAPLSSVRPALLPSPRLTNENERIAALLSQVHGRGGTESAELADLLDEEAALLGKALTQRCTPGSAGCELLAQARQLLDPPKGPPAHGAAAPLGAWLKGLHLPEIGFRDDPRVRELVEFHTENASGRERFQGLLFQCGAYEELFRRSLVARSLPADLMALVMVESGCVSDAESAVGARGLWQFMPATARAYHLRVNSGVIDERLSPAKSTDAGLSYLADLYRKLGSWELALASYNMGPFGLLARLRQAGDQADFWDLANSGRLPAETAAYVPRIQAYALILANLSHFRFETAQHRSAESSATLSVPAGTRLGLIAHAVSSSTSRIRELNPDIISDTVPGLVGERFSLRVPSDSGPRAEEALSHLIADADRSDECVPHGFDWGRQRFTKAMATRCGPAAPPVPASTVRGSTAHGASPSPAGRSARGLSR